MRSAAKYMLLLAMLSLPLAAQVAQQQGTLPDAPSAVNSDSRPATATPCEAAPYVPLTRREKAARWGHYTYSPFTFATVTLNAGWAQMMGDWPTYGGGMEGFGKRFGATLANTEASGFFKIYLLPTVLHQDPRYFRSSSKGVKARAWYAATRVIITRHDDGDNTFNSSEIVGTAFSAALTNAYYPRRDRGFSDTMSRIGGTLFSDASANLLREFWPDIRRALRKHEPDRMKRIENRLPKPIVKVAEATAEQ